MNCKECDSGEVPNYKIAISGGVLKARCKSCRTAYTFPIWFTVTTFFLGILLFLVLLFFYP